MLVAFLLPVVWVVVPADRHPAAAGGRGGAGAQARRARAAAEDDPAERQVMEAYRAEAARYERLLQDPERSLAQERAAPQRQLSEAITAKAPVREIHAIERRLHAVPPDVTTARETWGTRAPAGRRTRRAAGRHAGACQPFGADPDGTGAERDSLRELAHQFHRAGVLPDGRHRWHAAHPGALLHHAHGARGASRSPGRCCSSCWSARQRAGAGAAAQGRGLQRRGRAALRSPAGVDRRMVARSIPRCSRWST